jgi:hypothetical protein
MSLSVVTWWRIATMSSAFMLTFLPTGDCPTTNSFRFNLRLAFYRQSVRLGDKLLETHYQHFFSNWTLAIIVLMWHPLWREDVSIVYNFWWSSPVQSFSSPAGLMTIFYCVRFETPSWWRARSPSLYPPGTGWSNYTPRHCVTFSSPSTTDSCSAYDLLARAAQKKTFLCYCLQLLLCKTCLFAKPLLSNGCCIAAFSRSLRSNGSICHNILLR